VSGTPRPGAPADDDLRLLLLIRNVELRLPELFADGLLAGTTHTCLGQEYIPVALRPLLRSDDFVFSNHRGHGHFLAHTGDVGGLLAELTGREGAVCAGIGGSQHLRRGRYLSTGVQGQSMPVAAGTALHQRQNEPGGLTCVYLGDGTWGEGSVYEALNLASLWRLPLLMVVENNGIAQSTPIERHLAGTIRDRAAAFAVAHIAIDSIDIDEIRRRLTAPIETVRASPAPLVVEFTTHRLGPHSKGDDTRPAEVVREAERHDWYRRYAELLPDRFTALDTEVRSTVAALVAEIVERPPVAPQ